jgi:adenine-specific DNA methylase
MQAIFAECKRALRDDGVMTVMFTHKRAEAWDTLGMALMQAGFEIATSWPVNTEPQSSSHQMQKNAAASTVMLVCRKRPQAPEGETFFDDLIPSLRAAARDAVARFDRDGIRGVDLLLSTYGPVLSVISAAWPVYSSEADADGSARLLRPEEALDVARAELVEARRRAIVGRQVTFDPATDFWLIAWEIFQAEEFPYDEARRLALAVGGQDPEALASAGILKKKAGTVVLQAPAERRRRVLHVVQDGQFEGLSLIDILHGVLITADFDGLAAAKTLMDRHGLTTEPRFLALVQGAVNALPRTKKHGDFIRPEAATLDSLITAYLPSISVPDDEPPDTLFDVD